MYALILLDGSEISVYLYHYTQTKHIYIKKVITYNLTLFTGTIRDASEIIALVLSAQVSYKSVKQWYLCSKNLSEDLFRDIQQALSLPGELLTPQREQELLSKGIIHELHLKH